MNIEIISGVSWARKEICPNVTSRTPESENVLMKINCSGSHTVTDCNTPSYGIVLLSDILFKGKYLCPKETNMAAKILLF
jgi:hypothetical protein